MTTWPDVPVSESGRRLVITQGEHNAPRHWMGELFTKPTTERLPHVVGTVDGVRHLPHMTILRVQTGAAAQIINDQDGHYLSYAGTDQTDSLDPTDLFWDRQSMDSLIRMLPAIILDQP